MYQRGADVSAANTWMSGPLRRVRGSLGASLADGFGLSISSFTPKCQRRHYAVARSGRDATDFAGSRARDGAFGAVIIA